MQVGFGAGLAEQFQSEPIALQRVLAPVLLSRPPRGQVNVNEFVQRRIAALWLRRGPYFPTREQSDFLLHFRSGGSGEHGPRGQGFSLARVPEHVDGSCRINGFGLYFLVPACGMVADVQRDFLHRYSLLKG